MRTIRSSIALLATAALAYAQTYPVPVVQPGAPPTFAFQTDRLPVDSSMNELLAVASPPIARALRVIRRGLQRCGIKLFGGRGLARCRRLVAAAH